MKKIILLFSLVGMSAQAADSLCESTYYTVPYGVCQAQGNAYDYMAQPVVIEDREIATDEIRDRPHDVCKIMEEQFNQLPKGRADGLRVELIIQPAPIYDQPTHERSTGSINTKYRYFCSYHTYQYPKLSESNPRCPPLPTKLLPVVTERDFSRGTVSCLSCDAQFNDPNASKEVILDCLRASFKNVIATPLFDSIEPRDLQHTAFVMLQVLRLFGNERIPNMSLKEQSDMKRFVEDRLR